MSGAAEHLDQILRDLEDTPVMAEDGGSTHLVESHPLLNHLQCRVLEPRKEPRLALV